MKDITLLSHVFFESTGSPSVDHTIAIALTRAAHENRKKIIVAGLFVECEIEAIIGFYLFPGPSKTEQQDFLTSEILASDAVSFSQKKRLVLSLISKKNWLPGAARAEFDRGLKKMISLRNAFAHGNVIVRDAVAFLDYFEGGKRSVELTDAYWSDIETWFNMLVQHIVAVKEAAGMPRGAV